MDPGYPPPTPIEGYGTAAQEPSPYTDPTSLLSVNPFLQYTPTARAGAHIMPPTTVYPPAREELYPQYRTAFQRLDYGREDRDLQMRQRVGDRVGEILGQPSSQHQLPPPSGHLPMVYSFLDPYLISPLNAYREQEPIPSPALSAADFFEEKVVQVERRRKEQMETPTPTISRQTSRVHLGDRDGGNESPTKKRKSELDLKEKNKPATNGGGTKGKSVVEVVIPVKKTVETKKEDGKEENMNRNGRSRRSSTASSSKYSAPDYHEQSEEEEDEEEKVDWGGDHQADNDGDWVMEDTKGKQRPSPTPEREGIGSIIGSGRTGERDMRTSFEKLDSLLEDIFEESDGFPANPSPLQVTSTTFFSRISREQDSLLASGTIDKLIRYISRLQGNKRRQSSLGRTDVVYWDEDSLARILKLLEKSIKDADSREIFKNDGIKIASPGKEKEKGKGKKSAKRKSPGADNAAMGEEEEAVCEEKLRAMMEATLAAECCLVLLDSDGLPKQLYSEDLLIACVGTLKDTMTKAIFPVVEAMAGGKMTSRYLSSIVASESTKGKSNASFRHPLLSTISRSLSSCLPRLTSLLSRLDFSFSDALVIQTIYTSIGPFFISEPTSKKNGDLGIMKGLRGESLGLLRGVFARYESQRQWIIEEILGSLTKVSDQSTRFQCAHQFADIGWRLTRRQQLIQASTFGIAAKISKLKTESFLGELDGEVKDGTSRKGKVKPEEKVDLAELSGEKESLACSETIESALKSARMVAGYLVQKCGTSKANKTSLDTDYKAILDTFIADLLTVLYRPEWPAASIYLGVLSKLMMAALEDSKNGADTSAARLIALDHLGDIAARIREVQLELSAGVMVPSLEEVISSTDVTGAQTLVQAHSTIRSYLVKSSRDDGMFSSAREMTSVIWAQELQVAVKKITSVLDRLGKEEKQEEAKENCQMISKMLKSALNNVWNGDEGLFETVDPRKGETAQMASKSVSRNRPLQHAFDPIMHALLTAMDTPVVAFRSKALRGIGSIVNADSDVLSIPHVRNAIENRLNDSSPAVRDTAVELVGKYVVQKAKVAADYYPHIAERVSDSGLAVRKRVIKLLRGIFSTTDDMDTKIDICCKTITLSEDLDDTVKDLAVKSLAEMLSASESAVLLVDVIGEFNNTTALEPALQGVSNHLSKTGHSHWFEETAETLINRMIDGSQQSDFDTLSHIRAIYLLTASQPSFIDTSKASILLTYLCSPKNPEQQSTNDLLLKIFQRCIPKMPKAASTFAQDLSNKLLPMINRPAGGMSALKELVGCYCVVTTLLTREYAGLIKLLKSCEANIRVVKGELVAGKEVSQPKLRTVSMLLYICGLSVEGCDLDTIALVDPMVKQELTKITDTAPSEYFFDLFLDFTSLPIPQAAPTVSLGALFKGHPALILGDRAMKWMDDVFSSQNDEDKARLMGVIHEFLMAEVEKKALAGDEDKNVNTLIGKGVDLHESGDNSVSTAVVQRNIGHILEGAKSQFPQLQTAALDVLSFTVTQGLYHPLQCLPILISLETSDSSVISDRALALHATLHSKHSTLVNVRYLDFAKASYEYQRGLTSEVNGSRDGAALLHGWYGLVCEKRNWRLEFLKALSRAFEFDLTRSDIPDLGFSLYVAENLASLDYKLQEEIMVVVQQLSAVISTCVQVAGAIEDAIVEPGQPIAGQMIDSVEYDEIAADTLIHSSIVISIAILLKNHLESLYSLAEDKCLRHVAGKRSALGDKPAVRKHNIAVELNTSRIPLVRGVQTTDDFASQQNLGSIALSTKGGEEIRSQLHIVEATIAMASAFQHSWLVAECAGPTYLHSSRMTAVLIVTSPEVMVRVLLQDAAEPP
ncbi:cohesin loading factor subunit SCC2, partial [Tremellales sp. Uapishka_1]